MSAADAEVQMEPMDEAGARVEAGGGALRDAAEPGVAPWHPRSAARVWCRYNRGKALAVAAVAALAVGLLLAASAGARGGGAGGADGRDGDGDGDGGVGDGAGESPPEGGDGGDGDGGGEGDGGSEPPDDDDGGGGSDDDNDDGDDDDGSGSGGLDDDDDDDDDTDGDCLERADLNGTAAAGLGEPVAEVLRNMNLCHRPCDDFYEYACGAWRQDFDLGDRAAYYALFSPLGEEVARQQLEIVRNNTKLPHAGQFFDDCVDTDAVEARSVAPLVPWVSRIEEPWSEGRGLMTLLGELQRGGLAVRAFFYAATAVDLSLGETTRLYVAPSSADVLLPMLFSRGEYQAVISEAFLLAGVNTERYRPERVVAVEAASAMPLLGVTAETLTDYLATMSEAGPGGNVLLGGQPRWNVSEYLVALAGGNATAAARMSPVLALTGGLGAVASLVEGGGVSDDDLRAYLVWHTIMPSLNRLPLGFRLLARRLAAIGVAADPSEVPHDLRSGGSGHLRHLAGFFEWRRRAAAPLSAARLRAAAPGAAAGDASDDAGDAAAEREYYCRRLTLSSFADVLSHQWVLEDFPPANKPAVQELVDGLYRKLGERLNETAWLDDATRREALRKWSLIARNVGYNAKVVDYSALELPRHAFEDYNAVIEFLVDRELAAVDLPHDPHEFVTHDFTVQNAFYSPSTNSINLPAGLILEPAFSAEYPAVLNLGGYGAVIGHELTHSIDNSGRHFNGTGAFADWWSPAADAAFEDRAQCLVDQYSGYTFPVDRFFSSTENVNGAQTLGENLADAGGVRLAWNLYREGADDSEAARLVPEGVAGGLTNDQLFFVKYAQNWCAKLTMDAMEDANENDVHSLPQFRVIGPLSNFGPFADAFGCSAGDPMVRSERCEVW